MVCDLFYFDYRFILLGVGERVKFGFDESFGSFCVFKK